MEILGKICFIAIGGAVGAVARYLINISPIANWFDRFPFPTFFINVTGSFLVGFCLILFTDRLAVGEGVRMGIMVGFLGAFTTFSTFEAEIYGLLQGRHFTAALVYIMLSVLVGFLGLISGIAAGRRI